MIKALRSSSLTVGLLAMALYAAPATADDDPSWFQVEMIVFERINPEEGAEQWPRNIQLRYPFNWVALKPTASELEDQMEESEQRPSWDNGLAALTEPRPVDYSRDPFHPLPDDERDLDRYANAMTRSGDYRVLFHEAWRQPVVSLEKSPALLIQGGEAFGNHTELEGSITLSVSRYLHLHTRLWLTEFEPNYGQPPGAWPELPRLPNAPQPERSLTDSANEWSSDDWSTDWNSGAGNAWDSSLNTTSSLPDFLGEDYLPKRIVTLNEQRRMRSEELHYLDHPLMGLIIRITPYDHPEQNDE